MPQDPKPGDAPKIPTPEEFREALPSLVMPASTATPRKTGIKGFRTSEKMLPYDSTKTYLQMGAAVQASDAGRSAIRKIATILDDVQISRDRQVEALLEKLMEHISSEQALNDLGKKYEAMMKAQAAFREMVDFVVDNAKKWKEFELLLQKFDAVKQAEVLPLISKAFGDMKTAMVWYQKMIEAHRTEDQDEFLPILEQLKTVVKALSDAREKKVQAALAMEERFSKSRREYWAEAKDRFRMNAKPSKTGNKTRPVERMNQPYPVNSVTPVVALDPAELIEQAAKQIRAKEKAKIASKQVEKDAKDANSDSNQE